jgi:hypothetical protein
MNPEVDVQNASEGVASAAIERDHTPPAEVKKFFIDHLERNDSRRSRPLLDGDRRRRIEMIDERLSARFQVQSTTAGPATPSSLTRTNTGCGSRSDSREDAEREAADK